MQGDLKSIALVYGLNILIIVFVTETVIYISATSSVMRGLVACRQMSAFRRILLPPLSG